MTPKNHQRAVTRRARQNKRSGPGLSSHSSILSPAFQESRRIDTKIWNSVAESQPRGRIPQGMPIYRLSQMVEYGNVATSSGGGEVDFAQFFKLTDVQNSSTLTQLFDQYMIESIELWITTTASGLVGSSDNTRYLTAVDFDDANALSFNALLQYPNVTDCSRVEGVYRRFQPHIALGAYQASAFAGYANVPSTWIDSATNTVQHYGIKIVLSTSATSYVVNLRARFHLALRNVF